jgi:SAM-dependent methyltransferase
MWGCHSAEVQQNKPETSTTHETVDTTDNSNTDAQDADERRRWQKPELVINQLGDLSDKVVADLGAGIGYFVFKLLPKSKKVIAIDIDKEKIDILNSFKGSLREDQKAILEVRQSKRDNSLLQTEEVDIILIVNTVAYLNNRIEYFKHLKATLKPGGQIVIVDFKTKIIPEYVGAPPYSERAYLHVLEEELLAAGFKIDKTDDTSLEFQFMIFASK